MRDIVNECGCKWQQQGRGVRPLCQRQFYYLYTRELCTYIHVRALFAGYTHSYTRVIHDLNQLVNQESRAGRRYLRQETDNSNSLIARTGQNIRNAGARALHVCLCVCVCVGPAGAIYAQRIVSSNCPRRASPLSKSSLSRLMPFTTDEPIVISLWNVIIQLYLRVWEQQVTNTLLLIYDS